MILLGALLQVALPSPPVDAVGEPRTITLAEALAAPAPVLAHRVLGMAGEGMVEATVQGAWRDIGGSIDFAARPTASGWERLCSARTISVGFFAKDGSGEVNGPHEVLGVRPGTRYRLLDGTGTSAFSGRCAAQSPALATAGHPGFFSLECGWRDCAHARTALLAAEVVSAAGRRLAEEGAEAGFARCRPSQAMGKACPAATRRVKAAFATGFASLSVQPCHEAPTRACVMTGVLPSDPRAQLWVEIATTLPMDPAALLPGRAGVTGIAIAIAPPIVVD